MSASLLGFPADRNDVAHPSLPKRVVARAVAVAAGAVGTMVLGGVIVGDTLRGRSGPPPPRNS